MPGTRKYLFLFISVLFCISSCNDTFTLCEQSRISTLNGSFFSISTGTEVLIFPPLLNVSVINGSQVITNSVNQETFLLPLNPGIDSIKFAVSTYAGAPVDTIAFKYTTQVVRLSDNCGDINHHTLLSATTTKHNFDSIAIVQNLVDTKLGRNIKIFY